MLELDASDAFDYVRVRTARFFVYAAFDELRSSAPSRLEAFAIDPATGDEGEPRPHLAEEMLALGRLDDAIEQNL